VAAEENAPEAVVNDLHQLPAGGTFRDVNAVWQALGHGSEDDARRF
jgi:hypothetical protein